MYAANKTAKTDFNTFLTWIDPGQAQPGFQFQDNDPTNTIGACPIIIGINPNSPGYGGGGLAFQEDFPLSIKITWHVACHNLTARNIMAVPGLQLQEMS